MTLIPERRRVTPQDVKAVVGDTPNMTFEQGERIAQHVRKYKTQSVLELGFRQGVSTSYLAAAVAENEGGSVTAIDLVRAQEWSPNIEDHLEQLGLREMVTIYYEPTSYIWRLMRFLEQNPRPEFDLCYLDGAHTWNVDGFAFFLVDQLLRPGGWIIFDDLDWTYAKSPTLKDRDFVQAMPEDERTIPQVRQVFELLVKPHENYAEFREHDGWAYARKVSSSSTRHSQNNSAVSGFFNKLVSRGSR